MSLWKVWAFALLALQVDEKMYGNQKTMIVHWGQESTRFWVALAFLVLDVKSPALFTNRVGVLSNDFFKNLLDMDTVWTKATDNFYEGRDRATGTAKWTATRVDLVLGSHSVLRALAEVHACDDSEPDFVQSFCQTFAKVMNLDRFDISQSGTKYLSRL